MQQRLIPLVKKRERKGPQINYCYQGIQRIETFRGCPNNCQFCYEPKKTKVFPIPKIVKNKVEILDMNFLAQPKVIDRIEKLGSERFDGKIVYYELVCGIDYRKISDEIAKALYDNHFGCFNKKGNWYRGMRFAWDLDYNKKNCHALKNTYKKLTNVGYKPKDLGCFMIVNWAIPYEQCLKKLELLKYWNVQICDCCFDGGYVTVRHNSSSPIIPIGIYWKEKEIKEFRNKCRKHNQIVGFEGIDPEM